MNLYKTTFWNGLATVFKLMTGLISTKIVAVYLGTAGVALLGNFNNIALIFTAFSNGAISSGITKYIAEYSDDSEKQRSVVSMAVKISIIASLVLSIIIGFFHKEITLLTVKDLKYSYVVIILSCSMFFYSVNMTVSSILNGYRYTKHLIVNSMISSFIMMILAIVITVRFGLFGALINAMIAQFIIFFVNIFFIWKLKLCNVKMLRIPFEKTIAIKLCKFGIMAAASTVIASLMLFAIRNYVFIKMSHVEAGCVQGMWTISNAYLGLITTTLSVYYLPTLSAIKDPLALRREIFKGYKFILPLAVIGGILICLCKDFIILVLFTKEFEPMRELFLFQMIGDTLKIASWLLAFLLLAKAMTKWFIASELVFCLTRLVLSVVFVDLFGMVGTSYAYALNYLLYLIFTVILFRKILFANRRCVKDERK